MYFKVLYSGTFQDLLKNESKLSRLGGSNKSAQSIGSSKTSQSIQSIVENKELLINPNCPIGCIIDFICRQLDFDKSSEFDLCELETGALLGIKEYKPHLNGMNIFKLGQSYIIVFYEKDEEGNYLKLEPLVSKQCRAYSEIMLCFKKVLKPLKRKSSILKKKRGSTSSGASNKSPSTSRKDSNRQGSITSKKVSLSN